MRWNQTAVGPVPTQTDYDDYRDVAGIKVPFRTIVTWTDGKSAIELKQVRRMFSSNRHDLRGRHRRGRDGNYSIPLLAEEGWMRRAKRRRRRGGQTGETLRPN